MSQVNETAPAPRMTRDVYMYRLKAPTSRRSFFRFCALFGALVILTITLVIVRATAYSPTAAVRDYFSALEGRNATALWPIVDPHDGMPDPARSTFAAMLKDSGYTPPSNLTVQSSNANDNQATVTASYQVGSTSRTDVFNLQRDGARLVLQSHLWLVSAGSVVALAGPVLVAASPGGSGECGFLVGWVGPDQIDQQSPDFWDAQGDEGAVA